jgi:LmbE family N-acetylglucosaminyl deacetylase
MNASLKNLFSEKFNSKKFRITIVAAHPDDEIIGCGAQLRRWSHAHIIYVTDGSPKNLRDARAAGFNTREAYANARRSESIAALALAGIDAAQSRWLQIPDQETALHLPELTAILADYFSQSQPDFVVTHPYEGGHPDHDSTALAVHTARDFLKSKKRTAPLLVEMTSYHNRNGWMQTGEFVPHENDDSLTVESLREAREFKRRLFDCFKTQKEVLKFFQLDRERFRIAPIYNFDQPPHEGRLYYELFDWGMTSERWRELAREARNKIGKPLIERAAIPTFNEKVWV